MSLTHVKIIKNRITHFPNFPHTLQRLELPSNHLTKVDGLSDMLFLSYLNLNNNRISELPDLSSLKFLTFISVEYNRLKKLPPLSASLTILHAQYNEIEDANTLLTLTQLETVCIQHNNIKYIALPTMDLIDASYNNLQEINFIHGKNKIHTLQLQNNKLISFPEANYSRIKILDVSYNRLRSLPIIPPFTHNKKTEINLTHNCLVDNKIPDLTRKWIEQQSSSRLYGNRNQKLTLNYYHLAEKISHNFLTRYPELRRFQSHEKNYFSHYSTMEIVFRINNKYYNAAMFIQRF